MKIKKSDLIHLIREMAIDEMAYMGMPNIQKGQIGNVGKNYPQHNVSIEKLERFFKSKNWNKSADKFFGRAFPNSNVWVIPQVGDARSDELQFDKEESGYNLPDPGAYRPDLGRGNFYSINEKLLKSLGMPEEEIAGVNFANDIIFVPRYYRWSPASKRGTAGFSMPTPHMVVHGLFDGGILSKLPEVKRAQIIVDGEDPYNSAIPAQNVLPGGDIEYVIPEIEPNKSFIGLKAPITAALRSGDATAPGIAYEDAGLSDMSDVFHEILAGALLYKGVERIVVAPELEKWIYKKTGMGVKALINSAIEASRKRLKGKIVIVDI